MKNDAVRFIEAESGTVQELLCEYLTLQQEAEHESTSGDRLKELVSIGTDLARRVAKNPCATPDLLRELAYHRDAIVRSRVAANPNTPTDALLKLGGEFPNEILDNPVLPLLFLENPTIIDRLLRPDTLWNMVLDTKTSKEVLAMLIHTEYSQIAEAARLHVNWAEDVIPNGFQ